MQRSLAFQQRHDSPKQKCPDQNSERAEDQAVKIKKQNAKRFVRPWRRDGRAPKIPNPDCEAHEKTAADPRREVIDQAASPRHFLSCRAGSFSLVDPAGSDPSLDVGEIGPDFYAAEVGAFGANGGGDSGAE